MCCIQRFEGTSAAWFWLLIKVVARFSMTWISWKQRFQFQCLFFHIFCHRSIFCSIFFYICYKSRSYWRNRFISFHYKITSRKLCSTLPYCYLLRQEIDFISWLFNKGHDESPSFNSSPFMSTITFVLNLLLIKWALQSPDFSNP